MDSPIHWRTLLNRTRRNETSVPIKYDDFDYLSDHQLIKDSAPWRGKLNEKSFLQGGARMQLHAVLRTETSIGDRSKKNRGA